MSCVREVQAENARNVLLQYLLVLPLLLKSLMQMLSVLAIMGMHAEWQFFQPTAKLQIRKIGLF